MNPTRRDFLTGTAAALTWTAFGTRTLAQAAQGAAPPAPVTPVFTPVRRNVGFFTGRGGTIGYLAAPSGVVVIDTQFPDTAPLFLTGLNERTAKRAVDILVNTHHHGDHVGGNIVFKGVASRVVAHARAAEFMKAPPGRAANTAEQLYPTETFTDTWRADVGGDVLRARFYGPAHTSGDAVITFEQANVAHMGDLMFNRRHPVVDRPAGASFKNWIVVLEKTVADHTADTIYIFGHGGPGAAVTGSRAELMVMRDYITALLGHVEREIKAGKARDAIVGSTEPLKGFEVNGPLVAQVLNAAYDELSTGK